MDSIPIKERKANFVTTLIDQSTSKTFEDAVLEWQVVGIEDNTDQSIKCICGIYNPTYYTLINMTNRNTIKVGFDCLSKQCLQLKNNASLLCKQLTYQKTSKANNKRMCSGCFKHTINKEEPTWRTICPGCWTSGTKTADPIPMLGYKMCECCFMLNMDPNGEAFKDKCFDCFKNKKEKVVDENLCRPCKTCEKKLIPLTEPDYKDQCVACFKLTPKEDNRQCNVCLKFNIRASEPEFKDKCVGCFKLAQDTISEDNRQCNVCLKFNIKSSEPEYKDKCYGCFKLDKQTQPKLTMRDCSVCLQPKIKSTEPEWRNKCYDCFKTTKTPKEPIQPIQIPVQSVPVQESKEEMRACVGCKQMIIPISKPSFMNKCNKCFVKFNAPNATEPDISVNMSNLNILQNMMRKK